MTDANEITVKSANVKEIAVTTEERVVRISITEEELVEAKDNFCNQSLELAGIQSQLDDLKKEFKARMKPMEDECRRLLSLISNQGYDDKRLCYLVDDQELRVMNYLLEDGTCVFTRPLTQKERQLHLKPGGKVLPMDSEKK